MPSRDRVDDLEDEVGELKATVQGLTEELVEAHERIRQIERALAGDSNAARDAAREVAAEAATDVEEAIRDADPGEVAEAAARAGEESDGGEPADAGVESGPGPQPTEGDKAEGADGGDEAEEDADDIIVA